MSRKTVILMPGTEKILQKMGMQIKKARLRRNIRAELLAEHTGISRGTLSSIEKGSPKVSMGAYAAVLCKLGLDQDLEKVALDFEGKKNFLEESLKHRERARAIKKCMEK